MQKPIIDIINEFSESSNGLGLTSKKNDQKCAPIYKFESGSCLPLDILVLIAKEYNKNNANDPIILDRSIETMYPRKYKKYLIKIFSEKFAKECDNQRCWLTLDLLKDVENKFKMKLANKIFRPIGPQGKFDWLNTLNINQVMAQYEDKYKDFMFLGAVPMDFYEININDIQNLDYKDLMSKNKTKLGIIFNLDDHDQPGSHWIAAFFNLREGALYFYDSYGSRPGKRVRQFFDIIKKFVENNNSKPAIVDYNKYRHQYKDSECGMFSLYFIIVMLEGKSFEEFCKSKPTDEQVNELRNNYFIIKNE